LDIALDSSPGKRRINRIQIIISLTITTTHYILPITTTAVIRETIGSTYPSLTTTTYWRRTTPLYDCHPITAGIYHTLTTTREPSQGCQTSYI